MKNKITCKNSIIFILLLLSFNLSFAQSNLITYLPSDNLLSSEQKNQFNKLVDLETYSTFNVVTINTLASSINESGKVKVNLEQSDCGSVTFAAITSNFIDDNNYYYYGKFENPDTSRCNCQDGTILLEAKNGRKYGYIHLGSSKYDIWSLSSEYSFLGKVNSDGAKVANECNTNQEILPSKNTQSTQKSISQRGDDVCIIRVLFLYTPEAKKSYGLSNVNERISQAIRETNQAFANSKISNVRVVEANTREYTDFVQDPKDILGDLLDFQNSSDVAKWRNDDLADVVCLMTDDNYDSNTAGGSATTPDPKDPTKDIETNLGDPKRHLAYMLIRGKAFSQDYTFSHELGHIMGCRHQTCTLNPLGACDNGGILEHGHGWGERKNWVCGWKNFSTILHVLGGTKRILNYSNPGVSHNDHATGIDGLSDNAKWIREDHGCFVANYYSDPFVELAVEIYGLSSVCQPHSEVLQANVSGTVSILNYTWQISTNGINWGTVQSTTASLDIDSKKYLANTTIFIRVKVQNAAGQIVYGFHELEILPTTSKNCKYIPKVLNSNNNVLLSPNPVEDQLTINFDVKVDNTFLNIVVISSTGQKFAELRKQVLSGLNTEQIPTVRMLPGSYMLRMQIGDEFINRTFIKN